MIYPMTRKDYSMMKSKGKRNTTPNLDEKRLHLTTSTSTMIRTTVSRLIIRKLPLLLEASVEKKRKKLMERTIFQKCVNLY
jgi:hypothetical protein